MPACFDNCITRMGCPIHASAIPIGNWWSLPRQVCYGAFSFLAQQHALAKILFTLVLILIEIGVLVMDYHLERKSKLKVLFPFISTLVCVAQGFATYIRDVSGRVVTAANWLEVGMPGLMTILSWIEVSFDLSNKPYKISLSIVSFFVGGIIILYDIIHYFLKKVDYIECRGELYRIQTLRSKKVSVSTIRALESIRNIPGDAFGEIEIKICSCEVEV